MHFSRIRNTLFGLLLSSYLAIPGVQARERILLGLVDQRGQSTFRVIEKDLLADPNTYEDKTSAGLVAGTAKKTVFVDENQNGINEPDEEVTQESSERRAFFRPVLFNQPSQALQGGQVVEVSMQMGGGMGVIEKIDQDWGSATPASQLHEIPTSSVSQSDLTSIFQSLLDSGNQSQAVQGFRITSEFPWKQNNPFHIRFSVRIQDGQPWQIIGQIRQFPAKRVLEFRSSRPGFALYTINNQVILQDIPVAAGGVQRFDIPGFALQPGTNNLRIEIQDPNDGSSQVFTINLQA